MMAARKQLGVSLQVTVLVLALLLLPASFLPGCLAGRGEPSGAIFDKSHGIVTNWEKKQRVHRLILGLATNRHSRILFYRDPGFDPNGEHYTPVSPATPRTGN